MADLSPTIGKIDDIPIQLHWTFLLLLLLILFISLYAFLLWILLFVCVLVHELIHSITSKRNGIKVNKIVLYPFGGGSIIDFEKVNPEIEFRISIVGPIASLLLGMIFGIAAIFTPAGIVESTIQILFILNIFLGVFNLLPWLPLDGGRAFRSYMQKTKSFLEATKKAVSVSNIVTVLFIIGTIIYAFLFAAGTSLIYKEFLIIFDIAIAFFIYSGAQAELQAAFLKENTIDLKAKDALTKNYVIVNPNISINELYKTLLKKKTHIVLFRKGETIQMLSSPSLQKLVGKRPNGGSVSDFGIEIPKIPYDLNLYTAIERMRSSERSIAAVVKANKIVGILLMQHIESIIALHISQKKQS